MNMIRTYCETVGEIKMEYKSIETLELMYYVRVNELLTDKDEYTVYENTLVPKMYDHNFIYFQGLVTKSQFEKVYEKYKYQNLKARKTYLNFYFKVNHQIAESIYESVLSYEDYEVENVIFMKLTTKTDEWKRYAGIEVFKVQTKQSLDDFLQLNYQEDLIISESFAKDKRQFNKRLYERKLCDCYIAYYQGFPAASGELYALHQTGKLENLFVAASFRNKGIATELMRKMIDQSRTMNLTGFYLATYQYDDPIKLYAKLGFTEIAKQKNITIFYD